jgi:predicted metal-dependent phosphoesterase TrpH
VPGLEISTKFRHRGVHLLGYLPDPAYPPLVAALDRILAGRTERTPAIVAALQAHGIAVTEDDVRRESGGSVAAGRPHVADALVRLGIVGDRTEAFATLLNPGRPGYVNRYAVPLEDMIPLVTAAGGVPVIAHPWGRSGGSVLDEEALASLKDLGLAGIEVDHQDHPPELRARLRGVATDLDLVVTGSSDHHGLGKVDHDLGVNTTDPEHYERLLSLAARSPGG